MKNTISRKHYMNIIGVILLSMSLLTACGGSVKQTSAIPVISTYATETSLIPSTKPSQTVSPTSTPAPKTTNAPKAPSTPIKQAGKEQTVYIGKTGNKYHNAGCRTLKGNDMPISLSEALKNGREPCKICH